MSESERVKPGTHFGLLETSLSRQETRSVMAVLKHPTLLEILRRHPVNHIQIRDSLHLRDTRSTGMYLNRGDFTEFVGNEAWEDSWFDALVQERNRRHQSTAA